jgi:putative nucleotidyltransferase with HDIG domain
MKNTTLKKTLSLLNTVIIEKQPDGSFDVLGNPPEWFQKLSHLSVAEKNKFVFPDETSFLGSFAIDASSFCDQKKAGQILWSGPWEEKLETGENITLEAGALYLDNSEILLIRALFENGSTYKEILQNAREELIAFEKLTLLEKEMERYSDYLEQEVQNRTLQVRKTLSGVIEAIAVITEMRDPYTAGHQQRVAKLACAIAREMGLSEDKIEGLRIAGALHDIGKIYIPAEILCKPGELTALEIAMLHAHSQAGYDILQNIDFPWPISQVVLQHHENIDGSGYPAGLSGDKILLKAKILRVADVLESMASHRPYRPTLGIEKALAEIELNSGIFYDVNVVNICLKLFKEKGYTLD